MRAPGYVRTRAGLASLAPCLRAPRSLLSPSRQAPTPTPVAPAHTRRGRGARVAIPAGQAPPCAQAHGAGAKRPPLFGDSGWGQGGAQPPHCLSATALCYAAAGFGPPRGGCAPPPPLARPVLPPCPYLPRSTALRAGFICSFP